MLQDPGSIPPQREESTVKKFWKYSSIVVLVAVLWTGWTFYNRWSNNHAYEERAEQNKKAADLETARRTVDTLGGTSFDILSFYGPIEVHRGDQAQICYGVSKAKTVSIDPPVAQMWPSVSRCFEIAPQKTTTYTLTAEDAQGNKKTASFEMKVH